MFKTIQNSENYLFLKLNKYFSLEIVWKIIFFRNQYNLNFYFCPREFELKNVNCIITECHSKGEYQGTHKILLSPNSIETKNQINLKGCTSLSLHPLPKLNIHSIKLIAVVFWLKKLKDQRHIQKLEGLVQITLMGALPIDLYRVDNTQTSNFYL